MPSPPCQSLLPKTRYSRSIKRSARRGRFSVIVRRCSQGNLPARIPHRAGTSAVMPRFADIRIALSADFDVGSGLTFAFGYEMTYGVPTSGDGVNPTRQFHRQCPSSPR